MLERPLVQTERDDLHKYLKLLLKWQHVQRLVGSADPRWIVSHVVLDSLLFLRVLPHDTARIMDLGAGAGVPGVPVKIIRRDAEVVLVEARQRRVSFLAEVVRQLGLTGCTVVPERAEAVADRYEGACDAVVMRCAGATHTVLPLALSFVRPGGVVVMAGPPEAFSIDRGDWVETEGVVPGERRRFLVVRKT